MCVAGSKALEEVDVLDRKRAGDLWGVRDDENLPTRVGHSGEHASNLRLSQGLQRLLRLFEATDRYCAAALSDSEQECDEQQPLRAAAQAGDWNRYISVAAVRTRTAATRRADQAEAHKIAGLVSEYASNRVIVVDGRCPAGQGITEDVDRGTEVDRREEPLEQATLEGIELAPAP